MRPRASSILISRIADSPSLCVTPTLFLPREAKLWVAGKSSGCFEEDKCRFFLGEIGCRAVSPAIGCSTPLSEESARNDRKWRVAAVGDSLA